MKRRPCASGWSKNGASTFCFRKGRRTRDGALKPFKAGVGMMAAGTPAPVVPCYLHGTFEAFPPGSVVPRLRRITLRIGEPLTFAAVANDHAGWTQAARAVEEAVHRLAAVHAGGGPLARPLALAGRRRFL